MRTIKQGRNDGYCVAACAAMICNTSIKDFLTTIGLPTIVCGNPKDNIKGYCDADMQKYLLKYNKAFDTMHIRRSNIDLRKESVVVKRSYNYKNLDGYLVVVSQRFENTTHTVIWDSKLKCVRDPNPFVPARRKLSDYKIKFWTPVYNV